MLDLASVRLFILAVEFENLTRAAEAAGTVQPVVSNRIKGLEAALGRKLWSVPSLCATDRGWVGLSRQGARVMAAHDEAMRFDDEPMVRLVIGASDHALGTGLEHVIRHVRAPLPSRSLVELRLGLSQQVRASLTRANSMPSSSGVRRAERTARFWDWTRSAGVRWMRMSLRPTAPPSRHARPDLRRPIDGGAPPRCRSPALARSLRRGSCSALVAAVRAGLASLRWARWHQDG